MPLWRFPISKVMVAVAFLAVDFGLARFAYSSDDPVTIAGTAPMGLSLNLALWRLLYASRQTRVFWLAFLLSGSVAMFSSWVVGPMFDSSDPAWAVWFWDGYTSRLASMARAFPDLWKWLTGSYAILIGYILIAAFIPQILLALIVGFIASVIGRLIARRRTSAEGEPVG